MHNKIAGGSIRPKINIFIDRHPDFRASTRQLGFGQLAREDLRLLVAAMVD